MSWAKASASRKGLGKTFQCLQEDVTFANSELGWGCPSYAGCEYEMPNLGRKGILGYFSRRKMFSHVRKLQKHGGDATVSSLHIVGSLLCALLGRHRGKSFIQNTWQAHFAKSSLWDTENSRDGGGAAVYQWGSRQKIAAILWNEKELQSLCGWQIEKFTFYKGRNS